MTKKPAAEEEPIEPQPMRPDLEEEEQPAEEVTPPEEQEQTTAQPAEVVEPTRDPDAAPSAVEEAGHDWQPPENPDDIAQAEQEAALARAQEAAAPTQADVEGQEATGDEDEPQPA